MDNATDSKAKTQAKIRPIWGGFICTGPATASPQPRRASRAVSECIPHHPPRVGSIEALPAPAAHQGLLTHRLNSRAVATFAGFAAVGAFVLVVFLGSMVGLRPATATASSYPGEPVPTTEKAVTWSGGPAQTSVSVGEYGEQVAIATLTSSLHEVSTNSVTFYADPNRSGNALQQFGEVFGEAIATGQNPLHTNTEKAGR